MFTLRTIKIILALVLSSHCLTAQTQQPSVNTETPNTGSITGKVVDETGQPIVNATVWVRSVANNSGGGQPVATDRDGAFQVNGLERGEYYISANMAAYTPAPPELEATRPQTYRIGDSATLTLIKGGVLTGTVTNANGEPVVVVNVRAQMVRDPSGRRVTQGPNRERVTDDRGVYRIYGLPPGTYVVIAGGPNSSAGAMGNAYETDVPTYAHSATRDTAQEITVRAGEEIAGVDIRYRGEPGRVISGEVKGPATSTSGINVVLAAAGDGLAPWSNQSYLQPGYRSFSFYGNADGDYQLFAQIYTQNGENLISEAKQISVRGADVTGIELTPRPLAYVAGRMVLEESKAPECKDKPRPLFNETTVGAWHNDTEIARKTPQELWSIGSPVRPDAEGNFVVKNLVPGEYYFMPRFNARYWYVQSISLAPPAPGPGAKTAGKPIDTTRVWTNIKSGDKLSGLTVTLAQGAAVLRGLVVPGEGEELPAKLFVYLAPLERERADDVLRYYGVLVSPEGHIILNNIAPGRYWIVARTEDEAAPPSKLRLPHETETRARIRREAEAAKNEIEFKPCQGVTHFQLPLKPRVQ